MWSRERHIVPRRYDILIGIPYTVDHEFDFVPELVEGAHNELLNGVNARVCWREYGCDFLVYEAPAAEAEDSGGGAVGGDPPRLVGGNLRVWGQRYRSVNECGFGGRRVKREEGVGIYEGTGEGSAD